MEPVENVNLSEERDSVEPSDLTRVYLSSSNGKNTSLLPAVTVAVAPSAIAVSNCLLIVIVAPSSTTLETFLLGKTLNKLSLLAGLPLVRLSCNLDSITERSVTSVVTDGSPPLQNPVTVATPEITIEFVLTVSTLAKLKKVSPGTAYWIRLPVVTIPGQVVVGVVTVEIPPE